MPMTVIVTRDVEARYHGFLASILLEAAPGVYVAPDLSKGVRERLWEVLSEWHGALGNGSLAMIWPDAQASGGLRLAHLGEPPRDVVDADGVLLVRRLRRKNPST